MSLASASGHLKNEHDSRFLRLKNVFFVILTHSFYLFCLLFDYCEDIAAG